MRTIRLATAAGTAVISVQGAQVLSWTPAGSTEVLWLSEAPRVAGKPIRGGIPVCFPWFGARAGDPASPSHGFARTRDWTVSSVAEDIAVLTLADDAGTRALWPHRFRAQLTVRIGDALETALEVENVGSSTFTYEAALHGYLAVEDVERARITGLDGARYLDKTDGLEKEWGAGPLRIAGEVDAVHLGATGPVEVEDRALARVVRLEKQGSRSTVVWNPGAVKGATMADIGEGWRRFVCVEAANVGADSVTLAAGDRHLLRQIVTVG